MITQSTRNKPGPKPTGKGQLIGVRIQPEMLKALDAYRKSHKPSPSRPEAIREAVSDWLIGLGILKPPTNE